MTEHWNEHSLDFSRKSDKKFDSAEGDWNENDTGFTIDTEEDYDMETRRQVYADPNPSIPNLQIRHGYTEQVRADPSYRFLMMVAAFSKSKLGNVMNMKQRGNPTRTITTTYQTGIKRHAAFNRRNQASSKTNTPVAVAAQKTNTSGYGPAELCDGGGCDFVENTGKVEGQAWLTMPEISGNVQLTPEVYGHIKEAQMILEGFTKRTLKLKVLVENTRYQTFFARLVAIRMGLTKYLDNSDKQKDRIFSRLHQEQTMLLRRIQTVTGEQPTKDYTNPGGY